MKMNTDRNGHEERRPPGCVPGWKMYVAESAGITGHADIPDFAQNPGSSGRNFDRNYVALESSCQFLAMWVQHLEFQVSAASVYGSSSFAHVSRKHPESSSQTFAINAERGSPKTNTRTQTQNPKALNDIAVAQHSNYIQWIFYATSDRRVYL